jgi:hypothetical protein
MKHDQEMLGFRDVYCLIKYDHSPPFVKNALWMLQVPKTTIWRKLQQSPSSELAQHEENEADAAAAQLQERTEFAFSEVRHSNIMIYIKS